MDNATRLHYLEAMGIDVWLPRANHQHTADVITDKLPEPDDNWETLQAEVNQCKQCASPSIFGAGNKNADWLFIDATPEQELTDTAEQLLTEMLRAIELDRQQVFITRLIKCPPPANQAPTAGDIDTCKPYLLRQIALIKPKIIVLLGLISAQALLNTDESIDQLRGEIHTLNDTPVVVAYQPAQLLKSLLDKRKAWADLKLALQTVKQMKG